MKALLEIQGVVVTAPVGGGRVAVLRDIDLSVKPGGVLGLVGESGAGKSMIGRLVGGILPPAFRVDRGAMIFADRDLIGMPAAERRGLLGREIGFIPQQPMTSLNPVRNIGSLFDEHLAKLGVAGRAERRAQAVAALEAVHLPEPASLLGRYAHELSGGMCQRVLIAMAFASRPKLLVADEPTTALDVITQARIVALLGDLCRQYGTAVLFVTHDLRLAAQICDEIAVMYAGEVVERAPARDLLSAPRHPYSQALRSCSPSLDGPLARLVSLPEHMPGLGALAGMAGCRFAPRCPIADHRCAGHAPPLAEAAPGRWVRAAGQCLSAALPARGDVPHGKGDAEGGARVALAAEGLHKTFVSRHPLLFWKKRRVDAVKNVSFRLRAGEFLGIVGQSGSGKSTVARMLLGLEVPSAGRIALDGADVTGRFSAHAAERTKRIQMIFQDPQSALNPRRRVASIVTQPMEVVGRPAWPERLARAKKLLAETGLAPEMAERFPAQLSGGQRQRVNIARSLCNTPRVLVADEIVSGLDVSVQAQILNLLADLRDHHEIALVLISHDLSVVRYLCDRVIVMYRGEAVEEGETETVFRSPRHWYTKALLAAVPPDDVNHVWDPHTASSALSRLDPAIES
ncbi:MAG: ABC transporter ATP-binding protein [Alphaproteobacteria bacterium]